MAQRETKNIVVIGAGFGGLRVALDLEKNLHHRDYRVIVLDKRAHHLYPPLLYEVATGYFEEESGECEGLLKQGACMMIERFPSIVSGRRVTFMPFDAVKIDSATREIVCSDGEKISYEYAVLAVGSVVDYPPIPGLKEHAFALKTVDDALGIRRLVRDYIDRRRKGIEEKVSVVICGAGASGVELASELTGFFHHMMMHGYLALGDFSVTLVEATNRVLGAFTPETSAAALNRLHHLGVKVMLDTIAKSVESGKVVLAPRPLRGEEKPEQLLWEFATTPEKSIKADIIVWAGGVRAPDFVAQLGFAADRKGRILIDPTMFIQGQDRIFAIGDCAALEDPVTKQPYPQLARVAISQAKVVARNIRHAIYKNQLEKFKKPMSGAVIPMGGKWAVAEAFGMRISGFSGYVLRKIIDLNYFLSILPFRQALVFWWRGARIYIKND